MDETLETLASSIDKARSAALSGSGDPPPEAQALTDLSLRMKKLRRAWGRPQSLGFFGPSQAGKSFLVGALLSHELGTLKVRSREGEVDFLQDINPAKGVESTGTVTRFSSAAPPAALVRGDFYCSLLSLEVMLESMATGFLVECTAPPVDAERVERVLREARLQSGPPAPALYRHAWDAVWHNTLKKYQDRHPYLNELRRHPELRTEAWKRGIGSVAGWTHVFSLLWGGRGYSKDLDRLGDILIAGLEALGHPESVEVELDYVRASSVNPSVIDAACLNAIGTPQGTMHVYVPESQREVAIEPSALAALISEIRLPLVPVEGSLLDNTDLLDFPGGRALRGINGFEPTELNTGNLENAIEVFKRGKLTFLFEQFSLDREITALVLASPGPTKPEAIQMQHQVERWLQIRHGAPTPLDTEEIGRPSLFMALTKYDMSLGSLRSDNARDRWDSRVEEACVEFWARSHQSWIYNWGEKEPALRQHVLDPQPVRGPDEHAEAGDPRLRRREAGLSRVARGPDLRRAARRQVGGDGGRERQGPAPERDPAAREPPPREARRGHQEEGAPRRSSARSTPSCSRRSGCSRPRATRRRSASGSSTTRRRSSPRCARRDDPALQRRRLRRARWSSSRSRTTSCSQEIRAFYKTLAPMSIKVSDKVKKLMVHVLKHWAQRAVSRIRELGDRPPEPRSSTATCARSCTSRSRSCPVLGKAIFPYFNKSDIDLRARRDDHAGEDQRRAPEPLRRSRPAHAGSMPVRLSYSETERPPGRPSDDGTARSTGPTSTSTTSRARRRSPSTSRSSSRATATSSTGRGSSPAST